MNKELKTTEEQEAAIKLINEILIKVGKQTINDLEIFDNTNMDPSTKFNDNDDLDDDDLDDALEDDDLIYIDLEDNSDDNSDDNPDDNVDDNPADDSEEDEDLEDEDLEDDDSEDSPGNDSEDDVVIHQIQDDHKVRRSNKENSPEYEYAKSRLFNITNFNEIYKLTDGLNTTEKGDLFELFTKYIFKYHVNFMNEIKNIWLFDELSEEQLEMLNIPPVDKGIDLVALTKNNEYYAIQCKFRTDLYEVVSWKDLSTFVGLALGIGRFNKAFYVTNTFNINEMITKNPDKLISVYGNFFTDLPLSFFKSLNNECKNNDNNEVMVVAKKPFTHQLQVHNRCIAHYMVNDKGYIEIACGAGKTLTSYWINKTMVNKLTIVAVPSLYLLSQMYKAWADQAILEGAMFNFVLVGSNADVNKEDINNGLLVATKVDQIKNKVSEIIRNKKFLNIETHKIVCMTTYQSSDRVIKALKDLNLVPDMCFFDEAHKTVGQKGGQFNLLLDDDNLKIKKRMFMTATPRCYKGTNNNNDIISMDKEEWYGETIYRYNMYDAINNKILVDYQIVTMYTDNKYIEDFIKKNKYVSIETDREKEAHYIASAIMILTSLKNGESNHMLTYHKNIKESKKFIAILKTLLVYYKFGDKKIGLFQIDGKMNIKKRNKVIDAFEKSEISVLASAKVLNEGIDIPIIDSVCFVDPRTAQIDIIQCVGRALRKYDGKNMAHIYIPVIINDNNINEQTIFGTVIDVIKSISDSDKSIKDYFIAKQHGCPINNNNKIRIDNHMSIEKFSKKINIETWIDSIQMIIWDKVDHWEKMYNELIGWVTKYKKLPVRNSKDEIECKLANWCGTQKGNKVENILTDEKINKLQAIKGWKWSENFDDIFHKMVNRMKMFIEKNKRLPKSNKKNNKIESKLAKWCTEQKSKKNNNKLSDDKIIILESIPGWQWLDKSKANIKKSLVERISELLKFVKDNKKIPVPHISNEKSLARFCDRLIEKKEKGELSEIQIKECESIDGWKWGRDRFNEIYIELRKWIEKNKKFPSTVSNDPIEKKLAQWIGYQRGNKKNNKLDDDRINKLESLKDWFWNKESKNNTNHEV